MNKRGDSVVNISFWYVAYFLFLALFFGGMFYWVVGFQDGAARWEDFYAKEIVGLINSAQPGQEVFLDVSEGTRIGFDKGVAPQDMFVIDNVRNEVIVQLRPHGSTRFSFFRKVIVAEPELHAPDLAASGENVNRFYFKIVEETDAS